MGQIWMQIPWISGSLLDAIQQTFLGFTCGDKGGQYSQLSVDREDPSGPVIFESNSWDASSGWVMDVLAKEVCKTAIEDEAKSNNPDKHAKFFWSIVAAIFGFPVR